MKLKEMSTEQLMIELHKEFSQAQLKLAQPKLPELIKTSETPEQLVARIYEVVNVQVEENQVKINKKINRLDTRKNIL